MSKRRGNGEGSIYQMSDGRWRAALSLGLRDGKPVRKVFTAQTRREVQEQLAKALRDRQLGLPLGPERLTVGAFLDHWLTDVVKHTVRPKTRRTYEDLVRIHIKPALGAQPLARLTPQRVRTFMNNKLTTPQAPRSKTRPDQAPPEPRPLSARTVKHILVTLRGALETAVKDGVVPRNVAALVDPPKCKRPDLVTFTPDQARDFIEAVRGERLEALFTVAASLGLRQGEILGLALSDVNLESGVLTVRAALQRVNKKLVQVEPKSDKSRRGIMLPAIAVSALAAHFGRREQEIRWAVEGWKESGYLFTTTRGTPLDARSVIRKFHQILKAAQLPRMRFHDLRHSAATLLLAQGVSPRYISDLLGHAQVSFTMQTYAHVLPHVQREVAAKMDEILKPIATSVATDLTSKRAS
jgi:integrase